jgi:hypothetical protein
MSQSGPRKRPAVIAYHLVWNFVDWVFPPRCGGCDQFGERCDPVDRTLLRLLRASTKPIGLLCAVSQPASYV